jgi:hypothetical protein
VAEAQRSEVAQSVPGITRHSDWIPYPEVVPETMLHVKWPNFDKTGVETLFPHWVRL